MKPSSPARQQMKPLTPEEQQEHQMKLYIQKKGSLAEGILFNLCQNPNLDELRGDKTTVELANDMATEFMAKVYMLDIVEKKSEE